ncbi:MAG: hypothetical protein J5940_02425 [Clostridia bacterium]|nr:hypothetical protein [Clostridia bacterium]
MKNSDTEVRHHIFEEHDKNNPEGDYTVKRNKTADIIARIVCFLLAIFVWIYAVSSSNTNYTQPFDGIPVNMTGTADGYTVEGTDTPIVVTVTVMGRRRDVRKVSGDDIAAEIDLGSFTPDFSSADENGRITHKFDISVTIDNKAVAASEISPSSITLTLKKNGS